WRGGAEEILDVIVERTCHPVGLPHGGEVIDAIDADQRLDGGIDRGVGVARIAAGKDRRAAPRGPPGRQKRAPGGPGGPKEARMSAMRPGSMPSAAASARTNCTAAMMSWTACGNALWPFLAKR